MVIVGRGHCLKVTKTSVLTEPSGKELVNISQGLHRSPGNTRGPNLDEWKHQAILRSIKTLPGPFGV